MIKLLKGQSEHQDLAWWMSQAIFLSWFTIIYNIIEGIVSIWFGLEDGSIALAGFGFDSLIEVASAMLVLWRFRDGLSLRRERASSLGIGILFILLATITIFAAVFQLNKNSHPQTTIPGVIISTLSLGFMFFLWYSKLKVAAALNSATMKNDAACSLACIKLSIVLFVGSLLYFFYPEMWWVDSLAAIILAVFIWREGWQTLRNAWKATGKGCSCCG